MMEELTLELYTAGSMSASKVLNFPIYFLEPLIHVLCHLPIFVISFSSLFSSIDICNVTAELGIEISSLRVSLLWFCCEVEGLFLSLSAIWLFALFSSAILKVNCLIDLCVNSLPE